MHKSMERASNVQDLTSEGKKRALGDTNFEDSESPCKQTWKAYISASGFPKAPFTRALVGFSPPQRVNPSAVNLQ